MTEPVSAQDARPLGEALKNQLAQDSLDTEQLRDLMTMQQAVLAADPQADRKPRDSWQLRATAMCAILLIGALLVWRMPGTVNPDYTQQIALEVVKNHLKLKPLDLAAGSIKEVRDYFTQLDFSPVNSRLLDSRFDLQESSMLGGRYCSIRGVTAAQLRYKRDDDGLSTLYEVAYDPQTYGVIPSIDRDEQPLELTVKGLKVYLWVEKGLLMVLVGQT